MKKKKPIKNLWFEKGKPLTAADFVKGEIYEIDHGPAKRATNHGSMQAGRHAFGAPAPGAPEALI